MQTHMEGGPGKTQGEDSCLQAKERPREEPTPLASGSGMSSLQNHEKTHVSSLSSQSVVCCPGSPCKLTYGSQALQTHMWGGLAPTKSYMGGLGPANSYMGGLAPHKLIHTRALLTHTWVAQPPQTHMWRLGSSQTRVVA